MTCVSLLASVQIVLVHTYSIESPWELHAAGPSKDRSETTLFTPAMPGYRYQFPRDHGSHDTFRTEWWYYTGQLTGDKGHRFGFELTFFRRGMPQEQIQTHPSRWTINQLYLAHFAITDIDGRSFSYAEKVSRAGLGKAGADPNRLRVWIDRWRAEAGVEALAPHHLTAASEGCSIDLTLTPLKAPVIHGMDGISKKGAREGQASHYYSLTRLASQGSVSIGDVTYSVSGTSWMDHEFGSADLGPRLVGWDWFSLHLDNDTELMLYRLRRDDGTSDPASSGTLILPDGGTVALSHADFHLEPTSFWTSPTSHARYPQQWRVTLNAVDLTLEITPLLAEQELNTNRSTQVTYWEGAVTATGTYQGAPIQGTGYMELTGYAERFTPKL